MKIQLGTGELSVNLLVFSLVNVCFLNYILEPGGVQWMCAGKGIIHAEMPVHTNGKPDPIGLQLWVDLPKEVRLYSTPSGILFLAADPGTYSLRWW